MLKGIAHPGNSFFVDSDHFQRDKKGAVPGVSAGLEISRKSPLHTGFVGDRIQTAFDRFLAEDTPDKF